MENNKGFDIFWIYEKNPILQLIDSSTLRFIINNRKLVKFFLLLPVFSFILSAQHILGKGSHSGDLRKDVLTGLFYLIAAFLTYLIANHFISFALDKFVTIKSNHLKLRVFKDTEKLSIASDFSDELYSLQKEKIYKLCIDQNKITDTLEDKEFFNECWKPLMELSHRKFHYINHQFPFDLNLYKTQITLIQLQLHILGEHENKKRKTD